MSTLVDQVAPATHPFNLQVAENLEEVFFCDFLEKIDKLFSYNPKEDHIADNGYFAQDKWAFSQMLYSQRFSFKTKEKKDLSRKDMADTNLIVSCIPAYIEKMVERKVDKFDLSRHIQKNSADIVRFFLEDCFLMPSGEFINLAEEKQRLNEMREAEWKGRKLRVN